MGSVLKKELKQELDSGDSEISFPVTTDITCIRTIVQEFFNAPNLIERISASPELLDQLKFSVCLPPALAKRAVYGRRDLSVLPRVNEDGWSRTCP